MTEYRSLDGYKYQLREDHVELAHPAVQIVPDTPVSEPFIELDMRGHITIKNGYAWDGPSGPMPDWKSAMRASLVHDAHYQLMRLEILNHAQHRKAADELFRSYCKEDGMNTLVANIAYVTLRLFGAAAAKPGGGVSQVIRWLKK
jgi:hypothetical protein